jgi:hypothetical protein
MEKAVATTTAKEDKHSFNWGLIVWPLVILILYVLSIGPVWMMMDKEYISLPVAFQMKFYGPWFWAYQKTPLHKPLGKYLHLWDSRIFDGNEDRRLGHSAFE